MSANAKSIRSIPYVGFAEFDEVVKGLPSLLLTRKSVKNDRRVVEYLRAGTLVCAYASIHEDVFDPDVVDPESSCILTDGVWTWNGLVAYYVQKYDIEICSEFISHMKSNNWSVPKLVDGTATQIMRSIQRNRLKAMR